MLPSRRGRGNADEITDKMRASERARAMIVKCREKEQQCTHYIGHKSIVETTKDSRVKTIYRHEIQGEA